MAGVGALRRALPLEIVLRAGRGTQIVEPVEVRLDELDLEVRIQVVRGDDVKHGGMGDRAGVIEGRVQPKP